MTHDLQPYPAYRDSGVPWLGHVPKHWETRPLKRWVKMNAGVLPETTAPDLEFLYLDIGSVGTGVLSRPPQRLRFGGAPSRARRVVRSGDTIISTVRTYLKAVYFIEEQESLLVCSTGFAVLTPSLGTIPKFVSYLVRSEPFTNQLTAASVGIAYPAIAESCLGSFYVAIPGSTEQAAIVRFLDHADRRIRRLIRAKQKLIRLLEEEKQAILHRAVTRGLDPNVRLKPSGVEWLGDVPEHWEVRRLGRVCTVFNGSTPSRMEPAYWIGGTVPWLSSGKVNDFIVEAASEKITARALRECSLRVVPSGAVIIGLVGQGKTRAKSAILGIDACINQNMAAIIPNRMLESGYLHYYLTAFYRTLREFGRGGNQEALNCEIVSGVPILIPPGEEQQNIIDYLHPTLAKVRGSEQLASKEVSLLREYRTRLIADVVTGKLDVREAAARLPEETAAAEDEEEIAGGEEAGDPESEEEAPA